MAQLESRSIIKTLFPLAASVSAAKTERVVFPVPPFQLEIVIIIKSLHKLERGIIGRIFRSVRLPLPGRFMAASVAAVLRLGHEGN